MYVITLEPSGLQFEVDAGEALDNALERAGYYRPWGGCRVGGCGACMAFVIGEASFEPGRGNLGVGVSGDSRVLFCTARPTSNATLRLRVGQPKRRSDQ